MSIKEAKKILKLWQPIITVPFEMVETPEETEKMYRNLQPYADKLHKLTGKHVLLKHDCRVESPIINWPLKTYSQEVVLNW